MVSGLCIQASPQVFLGEGSSVPCLSPSTLSPPPAPGTSPLTGALMTHRGALSLPSPEEALTCLLRLQRGASYLGGGACKATRGGYGPYWMRKA